jgi:8-amino-7-oxononanoate synthase
MTDFRDLQTQLDQLGDSQRLRRLVPRRVEGVSLIDADGRRLLNFGGNDYLGLAAEGHQPHPHAGSGASPLVCGWTEAHQRLADRIADFESTESAVLFPSGFAACSGTIATLPQPADLILSDQLNHASLIDGCRLSRAVCLVYPHRDTQWLERTLNRRRSEFDRVWIVTDGVFSMDGHVAPLDRLCELADRHHACLIVDEAHATGVLGDSGAGTCEAFGVKQRVAIRIGTLSKAIGGQGGFVAGPRVIVDYLINRCRSLIYSTALEPGAVATASNGFDLIRDQPQRRDRVQRLARRVRGELAIETPAREGGNPALVQSIEASVPIIPIVLGTDRRAVAASQRLAELGLFVPAIRPPTVPHGTARLRVSLSAAHDDPMIDALIAAVRDQLVG